VLVCPGASFLLVSRTPAFPRVLDVDAEFSHFENTPEHAMANDQTEQATRARLKAPSNDFENAIRDAITISQSRIGVDHTGRQNISLFIFAKLIAHCMTMDMIFSDHRRVLETGDLLDHFSLAALGRIALDASVMAMYISDPNLNRERWDLRRQIFRLHELFNRNRFLTASGAKDLTPNLPFSKRTRSERSHCEHA
jgi:hypothetical protein